MSLKLTTPSESNLPPTPSEGGDPVITPPHPPPTPRFLSYGKGDFVRGTVLVFLPGLPEIQNLDQRLPKDHLKYVIRECVRACVCACVCVRVCVRVCVCMRM